MKNIMLLLTLLFAAVAQGQVASQGQLNYQPPANLVQNAGFERGQTKWTSSGGSVAVVTSGANLLFDKASLTFDASAASQNIQTALYTVPVGLQGTNCSVSVFYKGGDANLTLQALDGSSNVLGSQVLSASTYTTKVSASFPCPTSGTIRLRVASTADAAIAAFDNASIGAADNLFQVAEAKLMGGIRYAGVTNCNWGVTNTGGWVDFASDTDCTGRVLYGAATGPADSVGNRTPSVTFANLPAGNYQVVVTGNILMSNTSGSNQFQGVRISDGTLTSSQSAVNLPTGDTTRLTGQNIVWNVEYTTAQTNKTFKVQGNASASGAVDIQTLNSSQDFEIKVYRYPLQAELAIRADQTNFGWTSAGTMTIGGSTTAPTKGTVVKDKILYRRDGSELVALYQYEHSTAGSSGSGEYIFTLPIGLTADTSVIPATSGLIGQANVIALQTSKIGSGHIANGSGARGRLVPFLSSATTFRVASEIAFSTYEAFASGHHGLGNTTIGFVIEIRVPIVGWSENQSAPQLVNSVITPYEGVWKTLSASFGGASDGTSCGASPCTVYRPSGSWISSITRSGTGDYVVNFAAGTFSLAPNCTYQPQFGNNCGRVNSSSTSSVSVVAHGCSTGTATDSFGVITCAGPR